MRPRKNAGGGIGRRQCARQLRPPQHVIGIDLTKQVALQLLGENLLPRNSATVEITNFDPVALNGYPLSARRLSIGVRAKF